MNIPADLKFTTSDEWIKLEGSIATLGISDYAQNQLSDIVYVEINVEPGDSVKKNTVCTILESVKAAADVSCPLTGTVAEINESLADNPELVNTDPYVGAWMIKVEVTDPSELDSLMTAAEYEKYIEERSH